MSQQLAAANSVNTTLEGNRRQMMTRHLLQRAHIAEEGELPVPTAH
jgi:hypothetical protein